MASWQTFWESVQSNTSSPSSVPFPKGLDRSSSPEPRASGRRREGSAGPACSTHNYRSSGALVLRDRGEGEKVGHSYGTQRAPQGVSYPGFPKAGEPLRRIPLRGLLSSIPAIALPGKAVLAPLPSSRSRNCSESLLGKPCPEPPPQQTSSLPSPVVPDRRALQTQLPSADVGVLL